MKILVTGASGQLGQEFQNNVSKSKDDFYFTDEKELDITNKNRVLNYVSDNQIELIINCAAYTDVNGSETNKNQAIKVNSGAIKNLVEICEEKKIKMIHFSTDYVYNSDNLKPINEESNINPINWAKTVENAGAGEIILTSVRHEGLMKGFEKYITKKISNKSSIPVLVHGGCGSEQDIFEIVKSSNISGVILSSFLHYDIIGALKFKKKKIGNIDFLLKKINEKPKPKNNLKKIKMFLKKKGINVRL